MGKRKAVRAAVQNEDVVPQSFVELWHWCREYAAELNRPHLDDVRANPEHLLEYINASHAIGRSDRDRGPALRFYAKFVSHLKRLGDTNDFPRETTEELPRQLAPMPVPSGAEFGFRWQIGGQPPVPCYTWRDANHVQHRSDLMTNDDGTEYVVEETAETVQCLRLDDLKDRARIRCRSLMVEKGELPAGWEADDYPLGSLRNPEDVVALWLTPKLEFLKTMAATLDSEEHIDNAEIAAKCRQSEEYAQLLKTCIFNKNDLVVIELETPMKPVIIDSVQMLGVLARQQGVVEQILRCTIRGVELWLDDRTYVQGRPAKLRYLAGEDKDSLRAHVLELQRYLAELKDTEQSADPLLRDDNAKTGETESLEEAEFIFRPNGDGYYLKGFGEQGHVSAERAKGLHDLFRLVQVPGVPVPMDDFEAVPGTMRLDFDGRSRQPVAGSEEFRQIAARQRQLIADIEAADSDLEREQLETELVQLASIGKLMKGIGGKPRDMNNPLDKLRPKLLKRIATTIRKLRAAHLDELAKHFEIAVFSEAGCMVYRPAGEGLTWIVTNL